MSIVPHSVENLPKLDTKNELSKKKTLHMKNTDDKSQEKVIEFCVVIADKSASSKEIDASRKQEKSEISHEIFNNSNQNKGMYISQYGYFKQNLHIFISQIMTSNRKSSKVHLSIPQWICLCFDGIYSASAM